MVLRNKELNEQIGDIREAVRKIIFVMNENGTLPDEEFSQWADLLSPTSIEWEDNPLTPEEEVRAFAELFKGVR
jgi:hypothetical protein